MDLPSNQDSALFKTVLKERAFPVESCQQEPLVEPDILWNLSGDGDWPVLHPGGSFAVGPLSSSILSSEMRKLTPEIGTKIGNAGHERWKNALRHFRADPRLQFGTVFLCALLLVALFAPILAPHNPTDINLRNRLAIPSKEHWLGTDKYGRDVASRIIHGARVSLTVGATVVAISSFFGLLIGVVSGYFGGVVDAVIMRVVDVLLAFPGFLLALALVATMGSSLESVIIAIAVAYTPRNAMVMRSVVLTVREITYMEAAQALGANHLRIMLVHLLPNSFPPLIVIASIQAATAITAEAGLSFLGLGIQPPTPTWGAVIADGREFVRSAPWICISAGLVIMFAVMALNLLGDSMRDILDPLMRGTIRGL